MMERRKKHTRELTEGDKHAVMLRKKRKGQVS